MTNSSDLHVSELVELAYTIAKNQFQEKTFSFSSIWSKVWKEADKFAKEKVESWIGYFYTELSTDPRFVIFGFNSWKLKEFMTNTELKKLEKTIFSDDSIFEEEYEAFLKSSKEKKEIEIIPDSTPSDSISEEDTEEEVDSESTSQEKEEIFEAEEE